MHGTGGQGHTGLYWNWREKRPEKNAMRDEERRRYPRHASRMPLLVTARDDEAREIAFQSRCRDISGGGLSFLLKHTPMEIGQRVHLALMPAGPATPVELGRATVAWVQDEDPRWAGVMLDELLDEAKLEQFVQQSD